MNEPSHPESSHVAARFLAKREAEERQRALSWAATLEASLPALVALLKLRGAQRIYLFGSLTDGTFHADSDIDLAVGGLPDEAYFETLAALMQAAPAAVDLIELERADPVLCAHIVETGRLLFEASDSGATR